MEYKEITCPACGYEWNYRGNKLRMIVAGIRVYITCPTCRKNIKIERIKEH